MKVQEKNKLYIVYFIWNRIQNGLFIFSARNLLARFGFDVGAYYLVQEAIIKCPPPKIKGNFDDYKLKFLTIEDAKEIDNTLGPSSKLVRTLKNGQLGIGLKYNDQLASHMTIKLNDFEVKHRPFKLKDNEALLLNMYTYESFRGKNLAPYLRYESYKFLKKQGRDTFYSISDYFNKSTIKFKDKLKAKPLKLYFYIILFKKFHWDFILRKYTD